MGGGGGVHDSMGGGAWQHGGRGRGAWQLTTSFIRAMRNWWDGAIQRPHGFGTWQTSNP